LSADTTLAISILRFALILNGLHVRKHNQNLAKRFRRHIYGREAPERFCIH
jgi:hypothetical protein